MKLFLSSLAISDAQSAELTSLSGKPAGQIKLALIENAADPYPPADRAWVDDNREAIQSHGYKVEFIDLREFRGRQHELRSSLNNKDVIWFGGGNTFYVRWLLRTTEADKIVTALVEDGKIYGGGSAGAVVAGPTLHFFEAADDPNDAPAVFHDGLHLTETVVVPHFDNEKFAAVIRKINDQLLAAGYKTAPLTDSQALIINGNEQKII